MQRKRNPGKCSATPCVGANIQVKSPGFISIPSGLRWLDSEGGGRIIAESTPEQMAKNKASHTGKCLKPVSKRSCACPRSSSRSRMARAKPPYLAATKLDTLRNGVSHESGPRRSTTGSGPKISSSCNVRLPQIGSVTVSPRPNTAGLP